MIYRLQTEHHKNTYNYITNYYTRNYYPHVQLKSEKKLPRDWLLSASWGTQLRAPLRPLNTIGYCDGPARGV